MISFDSALGIHPQALKLHMRRAELISANIANAETPGYKARDIDFQSMLQATQQAGDSKNARNGMQLNNTHNLHLENTELSDSKGILFRNPLQPSADGNTVDIHKEKAEFNDMSMRFMATHTFLNGRFRGLISAVRGE